MTESTRISVTECAKLLGITSRAVQKYIKEGKISAVKNEKGRYEIDKSEFYRVFPDAYISEQPKEKYANNNSDSATIKDVEIKHLKEKIYLLKEQLADAKERELRHELREKELIAIANNHNKLLTHDTKKKKRWFMP